MTCNKTIIDPEMKLTYVLGFADAGLYYAVVDYFTKQGNWEREIETPLKTLGVMDDPRTYCTHENLQRCR